MPPSLNRAFEAAGLQDSQPQFLELDTGIVAYAIPGLNAYYVIPSHTMGGAGGPMMEMAFSTNGPCTKYGATVAESYQPGTPVVLARAKAPARPGQMEAKRFTLIMCSAPRDQIIEIDPQQNRPLLPAVPLNYYHTPFASRLRAAVPQAPVIQDRNYGRPLELLAGDWAATSDFFCHAWVGHSYASFGAERARVEAHAVHDRLRLLADDLRVEGIGVDAAIRPDLAELHHADRRARSILEGMGSTGKPPVKKSDAGKWEAQAADQQGIFRHERYEGELVDGVLDTLQVPEAASPVRRRSISADPMLGVWAESVLYDGLYEQRSARGLGLVKSAYVPVPRELVREDDTKTFPEETEGESWQAQQEISDADYPNVAPAQASEEFDFNTAAYWRKRLRARTANWKVYTPTEVEEAYGLSMDGRNQLAPLEETTQDYDLPPVVELTDPATGRKAKYYSSESFLKLLPDGSISISDGYGAEIRMARGRIVISSATDIEVRPGRDLVQMAPRHLVLNAGDSLFAQAANGSMRLKAEEDLSILAGNSGKGRMLLESRGIDPVGQSNAAGTGIVIKSEGDVALVGRNMYIGIYDRQDSGTAGLRRTKGGAIVLDSCGGVLGLLGSTMYGNFSSGAVLAASAGAGSSALALGSGSASLFGASTYLGTANLVVKPPAGSVNLRTLGVAGVVNRTMSISGSLSVKVAGSMSLQGGISADGTIRARTVNGAVGLFANATKEYSCWGAAPKIDIDIPEVPTGTLSAAAGAFSERIVPSDSRIYTGAGLLLAGFSYPATADLRIPEGYRMYAARWQRMLQGGGTWKEPTVPDPDGNSTMVYPGLAAWQASSFFMGAAAGSILESSYPINATQ